MSCDANTQVIEAAIEQAEGFEDPAYVETVAELVRQGDLEGVREFLRAMRAELRDAGVDTWK